MSGSPPKNSLAILASQKKKLAGRNRYRLFLLFQSSFITKTWILAAGEKEIVKKERSYRIFFTMCRNLNSFRQNHFSLFVYWKKVELCNSLFECWEVTRVFPFSLEYKFESWVARRAAWALGRKSYPRYKGPFHTIWRWLERSRINGFRVMSVFVKK